MKNPFHNALNQLERANIVKEFSPDIIKILSSPQREIRIQIPVTMDDGRLCLFEGYRVQYNNFRGPYKGGIRFHQDTNIDEVKALALWMSLKCAILNLPMGGGKGGVTVDPKVLSKKELESLSRGWARMMSPNIGPYVDVPAPDVNTTPEIMGWMNNEYMSITKEKSLGTFTGKPISLGGSEGRSKATGLGGYYVFDALREKLHLPQVCKVAIQGFGNVGGFAAEIFLEHGHTIIAISDSKHAIYDENGLDIKSLREYKSTNGTIEGFGNSKVISQAELIELTCDVLIPAALEDQITEHNADKVHAKVILELANGPTTTEADKILFEKGIAVIPDILANAGGVTVSTFEWEQNNKNEHWTEADVISKLQLVIQEQSNIIFDQAEQLKTDLRISAFIIAIERIEIKK